MTRRPAEPPRAFQQARALALAQQVVDLSPPLRGRGGPLVGLEYAIGPVTCVFSLRLRAVMLRSDIRS